MTNQMLCLSVIKDTKFVMLHPDDCCNPELYCVVNGTFNEPLSDLDFKIASGGLLPLNRYNGTYCLNKKVLKSDCKRYLSYID